MSLTNRNPFIWDRITATVSSLPRPDGSTATIVSPHGTYSETALGRCHRSPGNATAGKSRRVSLSAPHTRSPGPFSRSKGSTEKSDSLRGNLRASLRLVSSMNWSMKLLRDILCSRSSRLISEKRVSVGVQRSVSCPSLEMSFTSCGARTSSYPVRSLGYLAGHTKGR